MPTQETTKSVGKYLGHTLNGFASNLQSSVADLRMIAGQLPPSPERENVLNAIHSINDAIKHLKQAYQR